MFVCVSCSEESGFWVTFGGVFEAEEWPKRFQFTTTAVSGTGRLLWPRVAVPATARKILNISIVVAFSYAQVARLAVRLPQVLGLSPDGNLKKTVRCDTPFSFSMC